ncbi:MAG: hypothetical protein Q4D21_04620 [Phascolarctobacterium sp.]|nr:hypothetical protein [Phascolarctobacterium sp.]
MVLNNFLKLSRGMKRYNGGEYDGFVIVRLEWQILGNVQEADAQVLRERTGYCQIKSTGKDKDEETGYIIITMLGGKLDGNSEVGLQVSEGLKDLASLSFNEAEVLEYLQTVEDTNPIHQGANAIVPGGMVLAYLQDKVFETKEWFENKEAKFTAQFLAPINVGEKFVIAQSEKGLCVYTSRLGECIRITKKIR